MIFGRSTYPVQRLPVVIPIGIQTETGVEGIGFDVSAWTKKWPDIEVEVWHRLPGQAEAYLTKSRREGDIVYWEVSSTDTQTPGMGKVELMGVLPDGRKLSGSTDTRIRETICASTKDPPLAPPTWVDTVREMVGEDAIAEAVEDYMEQNPIDAGGVKTVNGIEPDGDGNVTVDTADAVARETAAEAKTIADGKMDADNPTGTGALSIGRKADTTVGEYSDAVGRDVTASAPGAHAEGASTIASNQFSHAEGWQTEADGMAAHAEGYKTKANGYASSASGSFTTAIGYAQSVFGFGNLEDTLTGDAMHSILREETQKSNYLIVVGNGNPNKSFFGVLKRSNAHTLDWDGNAWFAGTVEGTACILKSTTEGSTKRFRLTVDDTGTIKAEEVTA